MIVNGKILNNVIAFSDVAVQYGKWCGDTLTLLNTAVYKTTPALTVEDGECVGTVTIALDGSFTIDVEPEVKYHIWALEKSLDIFDVLSSTEKLELAKRNEYVMRRLLHRADGSQKWDDAVKNSLLERCDLYAKRRGK